MIQQQKMIMARMKTTASVDLKIEKVQSEIIKVQARYDALMVELEKLRAERIEVLGKTFAEAFAKSGRTEEEVMTFLSSCKK